MRRFIYLLLIVAAVFLGNYLWDKYQYKYHRPVFLTQHTSSGSLFPSENDSLGTVSGLTKGYDVIFSRQNAITNAVALIEPSVVSVNVIKTEVVRRYTNPFENPFFGFFDYTPYQREVKSIGTGIILTDDGFVVTNSHVVEGATKIMIVLADGRHFDAKLIDNDQIQDVAVLKLDAQNLPAAKIGTSKDLIIGEWCIAVGNPYGFIMKDSKPSVSVGVISAIERNFAENQEGKIYKKMIQTDAAINPGNSGGPLVNINGELIGINTFILSESGGSVGIGFAIPIDRVMKVAAEIMKFGKVRDIWFGFKVQDITPLIAAYMNLSNQDGVIITTVEKRGPADRIGIKAGDIIVSINGTPVNTADDAQMAVSDISVGDKFQIKILRNKKEINLTMVAIEAP